MERISYRQLIPSDQNEYNRLRLEGLKNYPQYFGSTFEEESLLISLRLSNAIRAADYCNFAFGAFSEKGGLAGICGFVTDTKIKTKHRGELVQMIVDPEYKGQSIEKILLELIIGKAFSNEQTEQITLVVAAANESAIRLYRQFGFVEYGRLENYYKSGKEYFGQCFFYLQQRQFKQYNYLSLQ
ncbi:MAG TPA: N-acetyltransferase [Chitinophagaceae bacterium]